MTTWRGILTDLFMPVPCSVAVVLPGARAFPDIRAS